MLSAASSLHSEKHSDLNSPHDDVKWSLQEELHRAGRSDGVCGGVWGVWTRHSALLILSLIQQLCLLVSG